MLKEGLKNSYIEAAIKKLDTYADIKNELYETLKSGCFPLNHAIIESGYTAQALNENTFLTVLGAYNYLIYLRDDTENALLDLKKGLPTK